MPDRHGLIDPGNPVADHPLNRGLAAWWLVPPDGGGGPAFNLIARQSFPMTAVANPPTVVTPAGIGGWSFDGSTQYYGYSGYIVSSFPCSFSVWLRVLGTSASTRVAISVSDTTVTNRNAYVGVTTTGLPIYSLIYTNPGGATGATLVNDGGWHHIVGVSLAANSHQIYVDGRLDGTGGGSISLFPGGATTNQIGRLTTSGGTYPFPGDIADVRFYGVALAAVGVLELYTQGVNGHPNTLNRYTPRAWVFGGGPAGGGGNRRRRVLLCGGN